ncbi:Iron-sulfur clusters transporter [Venturia nashicola]|nr:Iron-sulfur clusters transporter [Venturia nashicola]
MSSPKAYRVIQWATGEIGRIALRHFIENPAFELVGVWVASPDKCGKDAGELAKSTVKTNILATNDVDALLALDADCIHYSAFSMGSGADELDLFSRMLRSGKNVISTVGPYYHYGLYKTQFEQLDKVCKESGKSFHGSGVHPGFAGDLLPITLLRAASRVDHIHLYEVVDFLATPNHYIGYMGFGLDPVELLKNPKRDKNAHVIFAQSMQMLADALGVGEIERFETFHEVSKAKTDLVYQGGEVKKGMVGGQHWTWTAVCDGRPLISYHSYWIMGEELEPKWDCGKGGYKIVIEGEPKLDLELKGLARNGVLGYPAYNLGATMGVNVVHAVVDAAPGVLTHWDLGVVKPKGLMREVL